jgi:hypothetical protein
MTSAEIKAQLAAIVDDLARKGAPRIVIVGDKVEVVWGSPVATLCWLLPERVLAELEGALEQQRERAAP